MTILSPILAVVVAVAPAQASPDIAGAWEGRISGGGQSIRIVFNVAADGATTMDSPDQGARGIPATSAVDGRTVRFTVPAIGGRFEGLLADDGRSLTGALAQGGMNVPLVMQRGEIDAGPSRPQTPQPPFPYRSEEVAFENPAAPGVRLAGTLTLPQGAGPFPVAVLVTGSGPQDRDETVFEHKPFAVWADALTTRGVAVLRYDDRGVAASTGSFQDATVADFATDARAAIDYLLTRPEVDPGRIGVIGHSEGGTIAPMLVQDGAPLAWIVTLAGPTVSGGAIIEEQAHLIRIAAGVTPEQDAALGALQAALMRAIGDNVEDPQAVAREVEALLVGAGQPQAQAATTARQMSSAYYRRMIAHDPSDSLRAVRIPMLAVYGSKDLQVAPAQNVPALRALKPDADIVVLPGLNHLLQPATTGLTAEYGEIEITLAPEAISTVVDWVAAR
ncbi:alpha/beta hydrolase family protein [Brevundimonas sp. FT23042]|uniref:alpha/beta hydrolase family protein n=1 Tax=Brevundimonas sp. FT23042 TaxID=3393749 RepID=UPI003B58B082